MMRYPNVRLRRLRRLKGLQTLVRETNLSVSDFIYPMFITYGRNKRDNIEPMPGMYRLSLDLLVEETESISKLGIPAVLLFGIPSSKDSMGTEAYSEKGIIQEAVKLIKKTNPDLIVITDVCLCEYTNHGHCGLVENEQVDNDRSLDLLDKVALSHAHAGADIIAPSSMMDGQVYAIRKSLDSNGFNQIPIMAYSAKYASSFYGPFRVAADSSPQLGDRKGYQMDPPNVTEALREIRADIEEGADIVMVKPAMAYMDVIAKAKMEFELPLAAYNVSGEYAMVKAASENEWINGEKVAMEILTGIKRSGADMVISYHAKELAALLPQN